LISTNKDSKNYKEENNKKEKYPNRRSRSRVGSSKISTRGKKKNCNTYYLSSCLGTPPH
jgi:hypothetical protein